MLGRLLLEYFDWFYIDVAELQAVGHTTYTSLYGTRRTFNTMTILYREPYEMQ